MSFRREGRRTFAIATVCVAALTISACGSDGEDSPEPSAQQSQEIQALTDLGGELTAAVDSLDTGTLCSHLDPKVIEEQFKTRARCAKVLKRSIANTEEKPTFEFTEVTIDGNRAVGKVDSATGEHYFRKIHGEWYVTLAPDSGSDSSEAQ